MTVLVAGPVYSPSSISRFSAVTLEVEGRVRITCRHPCRHPYGFSDSFHQCFCVSIRVEPQGAGLEPLAKTKQPQQRQHPDRVGCGGNRAAEGVRRTNWSVAHQCCPLLPLRPARVSLVHMPYAVLNWRLGICAEASARAHRALLPRSENHAPLPEEKSWGENSGVRSLVLWFCSTYGRTVQRARSVPSVQGTAASGSIRREQHRRAPRCVGTLHTGVCCFLAVRFMLS